MFLFQSSSLLTTATTDSDFFTCTWPWLAFYLYAYMPPSRPIHPTQFNESLHFIVHIGDAELGFDPVLVELRKANSFATIGHTVTT